MAAGAVAIFLAAFFELRNYGVAEVVQPHQLAPSCAPGRRRAMGVHAVVAAEIRQVAILVVIALDLAIDSAAMPADLDRDPR